MYMIYIKNLPGVWGLDYFYKTCFFFYFFFSLHCSPLDILILNIFELARNHLVFSSGKYSFVVFQQFEKYFSSKKFIFVENFVR